MVIKTVPSYNLLINGPATRNWIISNSKFLREAVLWDFYKFNYPGCTMQ